MNKRQGWPRQLNEYLQRAEVIYKRDGFRFGKFDCCVFVSDWVKLATGADPLAGLRGTYSDEAQADSLLSAQSLQGRLRSTFGEPIHPAKAHRGDIAYVSFGRGALGIFLTVGVKMQAVILGEQGLVLAPYKRIEQAYKVGRG